MIRGPGLVKLVAALQSAYVRLLLGGRWSGSGIEREQDVVPHGVNGWVAGVGMVVVSLGQKDCGIDVDRVSPKSGDLLALNADMLHPLGIFGIFGGGNDVGDGEVEIAAGTEMNFYRVAVEISGGYVERFLPAIIHVHPNRVTIGAVHLGIDIDHGLGVIVTGRQIAELHGIADGCRVYSGDLAGLELIEIDAKNGGAVGSHGEPGLAIILGGDD